MHEVSESEWNDSQVERIVDSFFHSQSFFS